MKLSVYPHQTETRTFAWENGYYIEITTYIDNNSDIIGTVCIFRPQDNIKVMLVKSIGYSLQEIIAKAHDELLENNEAEKIYREAVKDAYKALSTEW